MLQLKDLSLESADHLIFATVSSVFQHPVPNALCRLRSCLRDLSQIFSSGAQAGTWPTQNHLSEKHESPSEFSSKMILSDPQKKATDFQDCTRNEQNIAHLELKHSKVSEYYSESTAESRHRNHWASSYWSTSVKVLLPHITLLLINSSEPKILFAHEYGHKAAS